MNDDLDALRASLSAIDRQILELAAQRRDLAERIGRRKEAVGRPTRDFAREYEVYQAARRTADALGLSHQLADRLLSALIETSLTVQEQDRLRHTASGEGRRALIIGGAGKMGAWFARFLASQGYAVHTADPAGPTSDLPHVPDWQALPLDDDLIVVAAPLVASADVLTALAQRRPPGVVFDVGSLKSPLRAGLDALRAAGVRVTSVHPMFGPDVRLLSGRHVVFVDCGVPDATAFARGLFEATMAIQVEMDLDDHDRAMAWVLGLSHAVNIAFSSALSGSGEHAPRLAEISSTTFAAQVDVARRVSGENPHLYYEIQAANDFGLTALEALEEAVVSLRGAVEAHDRDAFVRLMRRGAAWFAP
ncbi:MAG: prephenate dehydrogenase/arogenate dehydrogenase family protein [Alphaproteobacteria bacterium]|nr:prephenate dehydrogenase/arogenate dehydrogenase family protein [Alphaproteobacteria bacterium]